MCERIGFRIPYGRVHRSSDTARVQDGTERKQLRMLGGDAALVAPAFEKPHGGDDAPLAH